MCPVDLVEPPQEILGGLVDVATARVVGEVVAEGRPGQLMLEDVDLVQEENDARPHEPSRVDN